MKSMMRLWLLILLSSPLLLNPISAAETGGFVVAQRDTLRQIEEVTVRSRIRHHETIEPQQLKRQELERLNAHNVADALRFASGVTMKDYGGLGGLKTVNLRSMGSEHVGIYYDGIELGNAQNGVIDLGQLSLDNIEEVSIYQGQRSAILQTASDFAHAGNIYIRTRRDANLSATHPQRLRVRSQFGAAGLARISGLYERRISDRIRMNANLEGIVANGKYDFRYRRVNLDGSVAYDTTATRQNGDIQALRAEVNLIGQEDNGNYWEVKGYTYHSKRGIPGAIVNNVWKRGERQADDNSWIQSSWQGDYGNCYTLRLLGKYAHYRTHYQNRDTTQLMIDNTFWQQEAYVSIIQVWEIFPWWSVSMSLDERWNHLDASMERFAHPTRWSTLASLATAMDLGRIQLQASVVGSFINDYNALTETKSKRRNWAPALFASFHATNWLKLTGYAKRSFRMPTLNDLYYTDMGNAFLNPEIALQYDLGTEIHPQGQHAIVDYSVSAHVYHNAVHDKIVAFPKGQQFRWTMLNLGRVHIDGIDFSTTTSQHFSQGFWWTGRLSYTFQRARDVTDEKTAYYGHQIPYTPWHNGSATLMFGYGEWDCAINQVYTGERYCQQENIQYNHLEPWYTTDLHLSYRHKWPSALWKVSLEVNNLWNQQYDVIINYPMPGRNMNLTLQCEF